VDWPVQIVAVRHTRKELLERLEAVSGEPLKPSDTWLRLGWDARLNSILAELSRWDEEAVSWAGERFPPDALTIVIRPGARWVSA
jgi:hypothetical protein